MDLEHGGDIYTEGIFKGRKLLDFSSNINPLGVPASFKENIEEAVKLADVYPDIKYRKLKENIKDYLESYDSCFSKCGCGTVGENLRDRISIVPGNGASEILDLALGHFKSVCIVVPSFIEYEKSALKWNCNIVYSRLKPDMNFDYEDIKKKIRNVDSLIIGNPNNPNGQIIDKKRFYSIVEYCEKNGKTIIIDEAFIEFAGDSRYSFLNETGKYRCILIVRALTKFFALPGVRFGYGISSDSNLVIDIEKGQNPWNINCFAEIAAKYVLRDSEYIGRSLEWIASERKFMKENLERAGIIEKVYDTFSNFVLCRLSSGVNSACVYEMCLKEGAVIRKCENYRGLGENYIRLAIKDRHKNEKMLHIIENL
jgi:threonine-phosphate decarboxylase